MHAAVGNWIVVHGRTIDDTGREGQVVEVLHDDGSPPYLVHWLDTGRTTVFFPGPDTTVLEKAPHAARAARTAP